VNTASTKALGVLLIAAILYTISAMPAAAYDANKGPCDYIESWSSLKLGDTDDGSYGTGPITALQLLLNEPDLVNALSQVSSIGTFEWGVFDSPTVALLKSWQLKHGAIASNFDPEAGIVGEKTKVIARKYCGSAGVVMYTVYYPTKGGEFGSLESAQLPKYTSRVADQALRTLMLDSSSYTSRCNYPGDTTVCNGKVGGSSVTESSPTYMVSPFRSDDLARAGFAIDKGLFLWNYYLGVTIEDGVAIITFSNGALPFFDNSAVSPLVRGSMERTLKEFPSVKSVRFEIREYHDAAPSTVVRVYAGAETSAPAQTTQAETGSTTMEPTAPETPDTARADIPSPNTSLWTQVWRRITSLLENILATFSVQG